jgi:methylthioribulose-1-phosphate dehydratase
MLDVFSPSDEQLPLLERMAADAKSFWKRGWLVGTCGNLSVKVNEQPLEMLVSASGLDKGALQTSDFLKVGPAGKILAPTPHKPSSEIGVHEVVYRRTQARACYHVHSVWNNLASQLFREQGSVMVENVEMLKGLAGFGLRDTLRLPIVDNSEDMTRLARNVDGGLNPKIPGVLVFQHGIYVWGRDQAEARRHVEILEFLMEYACRLRSYKQ